MLDKGYHSTDVLVRLHKQNVGRCASEPDRGRRLHQKRTERHRVIYNLEEPHNSLGYHTTAGFAASMSHQIQLSVMIRSGSEISSPTRDHIR